MPGASVAGCLPIPSTSGSGARAPGWTASLHHLSGLSVRLAPAVLGSVVAGDGVAVALEEAAPLPDPAQLTVDHWRAITLLVAAVHATPAPPGLSAPAGRGGPLPLVLEHGGRLAALTSTSGE